MGNFVQGDSTCELLSTAASLTQFSYEGHESISHVQKKTEGEREKESERETERERDREGGSERERVLGNIHLL